MNELSLLGHSFAIQDDIVSFEENKIIYNMCKELRKTLKNGTPENWGTQNFSTFSNYSPSKHKKFRLLFNKIEKAVNYFAERHGCKESLEDVGSWVNFNKADDYVEEHIHTNSRVSAIYYCTSPEGSAPTTFISPYKNMMPFPEEPNFVHIEPLERRLVLFRSYIPHAVGRGLNMKERITFAANYR